VPAQYTKHISIDDLVVGMYIVGLDTPWLQSPFLFHRRRIGHSEEVARLKAYGVQQVTIDPTRGLDLVKTPPVPADVPLMSPPLPQEPEPPVAAIIAVPQTPQQPESPGPDLALARAVHTEAMTAVQSLFEGAKTGTPINSSAVQEVVHSLLETILSHHATLVGLIHMRQFEANLYAHAINTCVLALTLGACQELHQAALTYIGMGALLHDVGQVHLPRNLLCKPRVFTVQEQRLMQAHPRLGATMLSQAPDMPADVCRIVAEHHERQDGSGYPHGLPGTALSLLSRIVIIADVYETMLGNREGRPPLLAAQAIKELYQHGRAQQLDLGLVEQMVRCLGIYPVGSLVELSTGERGIVIAENPGNTLLPVVYILWGPRRQLYATPVTVNLAAADAVIPPRTILRVLDPAAEGYDIATYFQEGTSA